MYTGATDNGATFRLSYYTSWMDLGRPSVLSILKKINAVVMGASSQPFVVKWGFDYSGGTSSETATLGSVSVAEYGVAEYGIAEYNANQMINLLSFNASGSGKVVQIGFEAQMTSSTLSIQKVDIFTKEGRL